MLSVGRLKLDGNLLLSPMAGYTDVALRVLCRRAGAALVCSEMVHTTALLHGSVRTMQMAAVLEEERPTCIQLFGNRPADIAKACKKIESHCDVISFNFGCPASQIKVAGCGAQLLDDPDRIADIVAALRKATDLPLLPKMRLGNLKIAEYVDIAQRIEAAGADGLIVHGRTAKQGYAGHADWDAIAEVKAALSIPVIANGDIVDGVSAKECLRITKADGLAIGRAALGDPDVFYRIHAFLAKGRVIAKPTPDQKMAAFKEYLALATAAGLPKSQIVAQAMTFTKGVPGAAKLRSALSTGSPASILKK